MNIGILGTGDVGKALAAGFRAAGNEVMIGTRDPSGRSVRRSHRVFHRLGPCESGD